MTDKVYACDEYGDNAYADRGITKTAKDIAKLSTTNVDSIFSQIIQAVNEGDITTDVGIIFTTMSTPAEALRVKLDEEGFTHMVFYGTMIEYNDLVKCIREIEQIVGSTSNLHQHMSDVKNEVNEKLVGVPKTDAIFIWHDVSSGWGYGNTGSISISLMTEAGANNIAYTPGGKTGIIYDDSVIIRELGEHPEAFIFLDSGYIRTQGHSVQEFVNEVLDGSLGKHKLLVVEQTWNNYDPESADGLLEMAAALHPDLFSGSAKIYSEVEENGSNITLIAGASIGILVILGAVFVLLRRRG